ncbi:MAG: hypothetical protein K0R15_248 [Clostridiales bacterium]|jgi:hypothetical protein|nr:hypothetical protein [Clostridiales bacterium]
MSVMINDEMTIATISSDASNQSVSTFEAMVGKDMGFIDPGYDPGMGIEVKKPSIFANTVFLVILTVVVLLAGIGAGLLIAKKKIKKGLDYDENY